MFHDLGRIFLINAAADLLILLLVRQELFPQTPVSRIWKGGLLSSITYIFWYGMSEYLPLWVNITLALFLVGMILIAAFQIRALPQFARAAGVMMVYIFILGGFGLFLQRRFLRNFTNYAYSRRISFLSLYMMGCCLLIAKKRKNRAMHSEDKLYEVEIQRKGKIIFCRGLYDSGNLLVSQITGSGISILSWKEGKKLFTVAEKERIEYFLAGRSASMSAAGNFEHGIYLICYRTVGKAQGYMPGVIADNIMVKKAGKVLTARKGMVGISAEKISKDERFSVLLPEDIFS